MKFKKQKKKINTLNEEIKALEEEIKILEEKIKEREKLLKKQIALYSTKWWKYKLPRSHFWCTKLW